MRIASLVATGSLLLLASCAAKALHSGADRVFVTRQPPPESCRFLGEIRGSQGNFWTA